MVMSLNDTPRANRLHIGIFGRRNAGKSSLINALTGQRLAIVSDTPGTTADPVFKSMELHPVGPVVFIDTAGFDDVGELGALRTAKTEETVGRTDVAILVIDGTVPAGEPEARWLEKLREAGVPVIVAVNKWDLLDEAEKEAAREAAYGVIRRAMAAEEDGSVLKTSEGAGEQLREAPAAGSVPETSEGAGGRLREAPAAGSVPVIPVSAAGAIASETAGDDVHAGGTGVGGLEDLRRAIADAVPEGFLRERITEGLIEDGGLALLVMPQDIQAPKGRLILPQVQTIRDLLDRRCTVVSTTADGLERALGTLKKAPDLIITDSQCFPEVYEKKPEESLLTSFSILMAASKGDVDIFVDGASAIDDMIGKSGFQRWEKPIGWDAGHSGSDGSVGSAKGTVSTGGARPFHVLIAEACTHVPQTEDIGTVKIPRLLKRTFGEDVIITGVRGNDFPDAEELKRYDLIIHCGACMFNRQHVMRRIAAAQEAGVPITNYGIFLAKMNGILDKVSMPGRRVEPIAEKTV